MHKPQDPTLASRGQQRPRRPSARQHHRIWSNSLPPSTRRQRCSPTESEPTGKQGSRQKPTPTANSTDHYDAHSDTEASFRADSAAFTAPDGSREPTPSCQAGPLETKATGVVTPDGTPPCISPKIRLLRVGDSKGPVVLQPANTTGYGANSLPPSTRRQRCLLTAEVDRFDRQTKEPT